jgi:molybdopterin-guanine dinucleotide biosynthesis protein A
MDVTAAVLAGGLGSRLGGDKALVPLAGRPLISYPIAAAQAAGLAVVVVAKVTTSLPPLDLPVLLEPATPLHPLLGIVTALCEFPEVLAIPCDMPFLEPTALTALAAVPGEVATLWPDQPFPALYRRDALARLLQAIAAGASVRSTQARSLLAPAATAPMDKASQLTVNTPGDLARAEALLSQR